MKKNNIIAWTALLVLMLLAQTGFAQSHTQESVLSTNTWHRLSVVREGVYQLDYATLQAMGIDVTALNPDQIRLFGNVSGILPEKNSEFRPDDLTELAICVTGAEDGSFDADDKVLFYGQEPTRWVVVDNNNITYKRERNYYSDTTYYYLCVDSGNDGLRLGEKNTLPLEDATTIISEFPDYFWHEEELFTPYNIGQNWFGERVSVEEDTLSIPFVFPNLVKSKALTVKAQVLGRIKSGNLFYDVWVKDNHVMDNARIEHYGNNYYGKMVSFERQIMLDTDEASFDLILRPDPLASMYLDYVEIYGWRQLKRTDDNFLFRLMPSQFGSVKTAVWVQNTNADYMLWEVTSPLRPVVQNGVLSGGNLVFATNERAEKRYALFKPSEAYRIDGWTTIHNQNVHGITEADNLIITLPMFWEQAHTLADYHAEKDGLNSVVVDVNEIYNEFSTGRPEPTGIRDFVRMVYQRSGGRLKYLTLFGRASFDFRNLLGAGMNFVPCYETKENPHGEVSFATDDFFALMDPNEGLNSRGRVDIGVGRIPVSTVEEARTVLRKLFHYDDLAATHGLWKTEALFFADDAVSSYVNNSEIYQNMMDTICPTMVAKKLYCGAYPVENTTSGVSIPGAHDDLMTALDKGILAVFYTGHGGVKGLTADNVFTNSDIAVLDNYDRMPFVYTATCEFTKYDNPLLVSAGEQMFLNPHGGSVALFTACRPTYPNDNNRQSKALMDVLMRRDEEGRPLRYGDIVMRAKSHDLNFISSDSNVNIRYLFLGDPLQSFPLAQEEVSVQRINGMQVGTADELELHAMSMVTVEGVVKRPDGTLDNGFNGTLWVRFFDKKSRIKVSFDDGSTRNVYYHKDVLYQGKVSVTAGSFTLSFQVPSDIMPENGMPRFSFYAYDSIRGVDAMGKFNNLTLGGVDPAVLPDDQGPTIAFYWNTPEFENGQSVERQGVLYADLYDAQGIYHYDYSLGRDIIMSSNHSLYNRLVLNDLYEPALNDFRRGRIAIPVADLAPGTYEFSLKVWDTQDNPSEASLWFVVDDDLFLSQVRNYPNPFSEETRITLAHTGEDGDFDVNIEIFDVMGRPVRNLRQKVSATGGVIEPIRWDGCDFYGNRLRSGIYVYRLTLTDESGYFRTVCQRMIICR